MAYGWPPSHRNTKGIQPEVCELCGAIVPQRELHTAMVEGLRGRKVCREHRFERIAQATPSFNDYRGMYTPIQAPESQSRQQPIGADFWWEDTVDTGRTLLADEDTFIGAGDGLAILVQP